MMARQRQLKEKKKKCSLVPLGMALSYLSCLFVLKHVNISAAFYIILKGVRVRVQSVGRR